MRYFILATDTYEGDVTVYWSSTGWTTLRKYADRLTQQKAGMKLAELFANPDVTKRFRDVVHVAE